MTIGERLKFFRESSGYKDRQRDFAELLETSLSTYQRYESNQTLPKADFLLKLATHGCDVAWLIGANAIASPIQGQSRSLPETTVMLPHYSATLSAGAGISQPDEETASSIGVSENFVRDVLRRGPHGLIVAHSEGDSMLPTIKERELLIIDTADQRLQNGKIYALSVQGDLYVKRVARNIRGRIQMVSDNKDSPNPIEDLPADANTRVIGRVIWHGGALE